MTVAEARRRLQEHQRHVSGDASAIFAGASMHSTPRKPSPPCLACRCMIWSEHTTDGNAVWACAGCHRSADLTAEGGTPNSQRRQAADAHLRATAAAAPKPRDTLREALARLAEARQT